MGSTPSEQEERPVKALSTGPEGIIGINFEVRAFEVYLSILTGMYAQGGAEVIRFEPLAERAIEAALAFDDTFDRFRKARIRAGAR